MDREPADPVVVGKITTVFGVRGWVKIHSYTEPMENILDLQPWYVQRDGHWQPLALADARRHQKGLIGLIEGVDDRERARSYCQCDIAVPAASMPALAGDEYYWHQLEGLAVYSRGPDGGEQLLGEVDHLLETGANDVLVVRACSGSIDQRERLIPWLPEQVVTAVDLDTGRIEVDWDSEF